MAGSAATETHRVPAHRLKALVALLLALMVAGAPPHSLAQLAFAAPAWSEPRQPEGITAADLGGDVTVSGNVLGPQAAKLETPQQVRVADKKDSGSGFGPQATILRAGGVDPPAAFASHGRAAPMAAQRHRAIPYILPSPTGPPIRHA